MNLKPVEFSLSTLREFLSRGALIELRSGDFWIGMGEGTEPGFYSPEFFPPNPLAYASFRGFAKVERRQLESLLRDTVSEAGERAWRPKWTEPNPEPFFEETRDLLARFQNSPLKKAVPVVFAQAHGVPTAGDLAHLLLSLLQNSGASRIYGEWEPGRGILGATPEVLFESLPDGTICTMALAGTAAKSDGRDFLLSSEKDLREHQWVIDDLRQKLSNRGILEIGQTEILELPSLYHLHTPVRLTPSSNARELDLTEWARVLHPTAALGGYPGAEARSWLEASEKRALHSRRRFGAPFGAVHDEGATCLVAIRNLEWTDGSTWLGSGCGVVDGSDPEREWRELSNKRASVLRMMGLLEPIR